MAGDRQRARRNWNSREADEVPTFIMISRPALQPTRRSAPAIASEKAKKKLIPVRGLEIELSH